MISRSTHSLVAFLAVSCISSVSLPFCVSSVEASSFSSCRVDTLDSLLEELCVNCFGLVGLPDDSSGRVAPGASWLAGSELLFASDVIDSGDCDMVTGKVTSGLLIALIDC